MLALDRKSPLSFQNCFRFNEKPAFSLISFSYSEEERIVVCVVLGDHGRGQCEQSVSYLMYFKEEMKESE